MFTQLHTKREIPKLMPAAGVNYVRQGDFFFPFCYHYGHTTQRFVKYYFNFYYIRHLK